MPCTSWIVCTEPEGITKSEVDYVITEEIYCARCPRTDQFSFKTHHSRTKVTHYKTIEGKYYYEASTLKVV